MVFENFQIGTTELVIFIFLVLIFFIASAIVVFVFTSRWLWAYKVTIAEAVGNEKPRITRRTRARLIKFGDGGEEIFLLKRPRKLRAGYGKRIGLRQILWVIGDDGLWYNTDFESFNKKLLEVGLFPVDRDVRLANSSIRKGVEQNYGAKSFMDKYGQIIYFSMFFLAVVIFVGVIWFVFDQQQQLVQSNIQASETSLETMRLAQQTLEAISNIRAGQGGGLVPA